MAYIKIENVIAEIDKSDLLVGNNAEWAKEILFQTPTADVVEKSLFTELKTLISEVKLGSNNRDAKYGAEYAKNQIAYLVSEFIRIKVDGKR